MATRPSIQQILQETQERMAARRPSAQMARSVPTPVAAQMARSAPTAAPAITPTAAAAPAPAPAVMQPPPFRPGEGGRGVNPAFLGGPLGMVQRPEYNPPGMQPPPFRPGEGGRGLPPPDYIGMPQPMSPQQAAINQAMREQREADMLRAQEAAMMAERQRQQQQQMSLVGKMTPNPAPGAEPTPNYAMPIAPSQSQMQLGGPMKMSGTPAFNAAQDAFFNTPQFKAVQQAEQQLAAAGDQATFAQRQAYETAKQQLLQTQEYNALRQQMELQQQQKQGQMQTQSFGVPQGPTQQQIAEAKSFDPLHQNISAQLAGTPSSGIAALAPQAPTQQQMQTGMAPGKGGMGINPALQEVAPEAPAPAAPQAPKPAAKTAPVFTPASTAPNMTKPTTPFGGAATFKAGGLTTKVGPRVQAAAKADMAKSGKANTQKGVGLAKKGLGKFKVR